MIGVFSYTVILTFLSLIISVVGIILGFSGYGFYAVICLMSCGLLDGFDGKVARTKKNRSFFEKDFGVQIDSLCDIVAFGVLPVAVGFGLGLTDLFYLPVYSLFVLAGLTRLAYFNSLELDDERKKINKPKRYIGLPITCSAFIFSLMFLFRGITIFNFLYSFIMLITALMFVLKIKINKPNKKNFFFMIFGGFIEFVLILISYFI